MIVGVLKEQSLESRVSLLAEGAAALIKKGVQVWVEPTAGVKAFTNDDDYTKIGAIIKTKEEILQQATILLSINSPELSGVSLRPSLILLGIYQPLFNAALMRDWANQKLTIFSLDMLPRTTRAQSMDVLSSQANIAGYKAVVLAADRYPRYFPMFMTAAGSIPPAKVLILGAGVAGLQAIATSRRLGAVVEVFDTRPAVKEEVMSLGARFVEVEGTADASKAGGYAVEQTEEFLQKQKQKIDKMIDEIVNTALPPLTKSNIIKGDENGGIYTNLPWQMTRRPQQNHMIFYQD